VDEALSQGWLSGKKMVERLLRMLGHPGALDAARDAVVSDYAMYMQAHRDRIRAYPGLRPTTEEYEYLIRNIAADFRVNATDSARAVTLGLPGTELDGSVIRHTEALAIEIQRRKLVILQNLRGSLPSGLIPYFRAQYSLEGGSTELDQLLAASRSPNWRDPGRMPALPRQGDDAPILYMKIPKEFIGDPTFVNAQLGYAAERWEMSIMGGVMPQYVQYVYYKKAIHGPGSAIFDWVASQMWPMPQKQIEG
jgi:hypothetical protein